MRLEHNFNIVLQQFIDIIGGFFGLNDVTLKRRFTARYLLVQCVDLEGYTYSATISQNQKVGTLSDSFGNGIVKLMLYQYVN